VDHVGVYHQLFARRERQGLAVSMSILTKDAGTEKHWQGLTVNAIGCACVAAVLLWTLYHVRGALLIPWWFNTDEVVIYYEVVRQLRLDPSQTFFDIPGTPFMSITTVLTFLWWAGERLLGMTREANPSDFVFAHAQGVFMLMRALTLGLYVCAGLLIFDIFRRCANAVVGAAAALLFASLPICIQFSYFVRSESLGLVLCLAAVWVVLYSRWGGRPKVYALAGFLSGIAMAARYHFALVGLPIVLLLFFLRDRGKLPPSPAAGDQGARYEIAGTIAALFAAGGAVALAFKAKLIGANAVTSLMLLSTAAGPQQYPGAKNVVALLWILLGATAAAILVAHRMPDGRRRMWPAVNPYTVLALLGFMAGFVLTHPQFLWRGEFQLKSIQFYSDWTDAGLSQLGPLTSWWNVTLYYFTSAFPERWSQALFGLGLLIVLWQRRPVHLAFSGGALLCFVAHPLHMKLWPHHVIPWLPFLCFIAALPIATAASWLVRWYSYKNVVAPVVAFLASGAVVWACSGRLQRSDEYIATSRSRTDQIHEMTGWLAKNVPADAYVLSAYFALNEDGFRQWIQNSGVQVPDFVKKHRNLKIWWLERSAVDGLTGFICMSQADIKFFHEDFERKNPGSTYNPFQNRHFQPLTRFGAGFYELTVFRFDCESKSCSL
jgi:hypothetical protein